MTSDGVLRVVPDTIYFREQAVGETDTVDFWVRNLSQTPKKVRCSIPRESPFVLSNQGTILLAPGLETKLSLSYCAKNTNIYKCDMTIGYPGGKIEIPVKVTPPGPRLVPDTQKITVGAIPVGLVKKFNFMLSNVGVADGKFSVECNANEAVLIPESGSVPPHESLEIAGTFRPDKVGNFEVAVNISAPGSTEPVSPVLIVGEAVKDDVILKIGEVQVDEIDFGKVFYHQKRVIRATVTNTGINTRSFVIAPPQETPIPLSVRAAMTARAAVPNFDAMFMCMPTEGMLKPNESQDIDFVFTPPIPTDDPGPDFEGEYHQFSIIEIIETGRRQNLELTGKACFHQVTFSALDFDFGKVKRQTKNVQKLVLTNESEFLGTEFELDPVAQFRFVPAKGTIEPGKSKEISIIFFPKNFGHFEIELPVKFFGGLYKKPINLIGHCGDTSDKPFKRIPVYETNSEVMYNVTHPDKEYAYSLEEIQQNATKRKKFDAYITDMAKERETVRAHSELMSRTRRQARTALSTTVRDYTKEDVDEYVKSYLHKVQVERDTVDLGMEHCEGMQPRDPPLRKRPQPLVLQNPEKFGVEKPQNNRSQTSASYSRRVVTDENVLIKRKFKAKATTPQEISECNKTLTPTQSMNILASHETIAFGDVSVFTTVSKSFTITNNLPQHIMVSLEYEFEELAQSTPDTQIIPPRSTAGFDIKFYSKKPMSFLKTISYTINGHNTYAVNISAHVIPMEIQLSHEVLEFHFPPDSVSPLIKEFVTITNKSIGMARFNWTGMNQMFSLSETEGVIEPRRTQNIEITYSPTTHPHDEVTLVCNVVGGESRSLKCVGDIGAPKCSLTKKVVNFGLMPMGIAKTQTLRIKNNGDDDAMFVVKKDKGSELFVSPPGGRIAARDYQVLTVTLKSLRARAIEIPVNIAVAGAPSLSFTVTGQSELPNVVIHNSEFDFGSLFVGSSASIEATVSNTGRIPAILFLDFSHHPEFTLEFAAELAHERDNENANSITLVPEAVFLTKSETARTPGEGESRGEDALHTIVPDSQRDPSVGLIYRLYIVQGAVMKFNLVFQPVDVNEHSFELPCTMMNVTSSAAFRLQPIVSAEAIASPLFLSHSALDFGVSPIYDPENPHSRQIVRQVQLRNDDKKPLKWSFRTDHPYFADPATFSVEETSGEVDPAQTKTIHVSFSPREAKPYFMLLPVSVDTPKGSTVIGRIQLTGVGISSPYTVSTTDIALPIVPLNVKSKATLFILNNAFIEAELSVKMPVNEQTFPVRVKFPEGNKLGATTGQLPVKLVFCSNKPLSFSTRIAFLDNHGNAATVTVSCTADNSVFTLYPFFKSQTAAPKSAAGRPISIDVKTCDKVTELTGRFLSTSDYVKLGKHLDTWKPSIDKMHIHFIERYLNALVMYSQVSDFPQDFIKDDNSLLLELLGNMTNGKKLSLEPPRDHSQSQPDPLTKKVLAMKNLIHYLEGLGALLSSVKPEFLLSKTDFLQVMRKKVENQLLGIDRYEAPDISTFDQKCVKDFTSSKTISEAVIQRLAALDNLYSALSTESWMLVLMQMFKLFVMGKIDMDRLNKTNGVQDKIKIVQSMASRGAPSEFLSEVLRPAKSLMSSNIFSTAECIVLKWVSIHYASASNDFHGYSNAFGTLSDSLAFGWVVKSHVPTVTLSLKNKPANADERQNNAIELTNALRPLKLGFSPRAEEIANGNPVMLAIMAAYFFETLPNFLPIMSLDFEADLHKSVQNTVTISNPSKAEVKYTAKFNKNSNFSVIDKTLIIGPNETVDYPVQFMARSIKPSIARLTLAPSRARWTSAAASTRGDESARIVPLMPIYSSPIVVDLSASVKITGPDLRQTIEAVLYQPTKLELTLKNYLAIPATCRLVTRITCLVDEKGKQVPPTKSLIEQMKELAANPVDEYVEQVPELTWESALRQHKPFIFEQKEVKFESEDSEAHFVLEFVPITLGEFRCLMLFIDEDKGEFFVELIAKVGLPPAVDMTTGKLKATSDAHVDYPLTIDFLNSSLVKALAYSIERQAVIGVIISERKFGDLLTRRQKDLEALYQQFFVEQVFSVQNSSPEFYTTPEELKLSKPGPGSATAGGAARARCNTLSVGFAPDQAGVYPCKIVCLSKYDVRVISLKGTGLVATKELNLDFATVIGIPMSQDIPVRNTSADQVWNYKVSITGDGAFSAPTKLMVKPGAFAQLTVNFNPPKVGKYSGELTLFNINKEFSVVYKMRAIAGDPPAQEKVIVQCQARRRQTFQLQVQATSIKSGNMKVTTTNPIISIPTDVMFENGKPTKPFEYSVFAQRSGIATGVITFTDPTTKNYAWYVVEIHVDPPTPEQVIEATAVARKTVTVNIPIANPKENEVEFKVTMSDDDMFGEKTCLVPAKSTTKYELVLSPLKAAKRVLSVFFYSDDDSEFWYSIKLDVTEATANVLVPVSSPLGKFAPNFINFENPINSPVSFRIDNDNPTAFQVVGKSFITLQAMEKVRIEVRYIPTCLGQKEECTITFVSQEIGDWVYKLSGTGKPPQPLSPIVVSCPMCQTSSALVQFSNPFPYPSKFSITMKSDDDSQENFRLLVKKKVFTLKAYGDEYQVPFIFAPRKVGNYMANIVIASLGPARGPIPELGTSLPSVTWVYPIIGNASVGMSSEQKVLKCRAHQSITTPLAFTLIGEKDGFPSPHDYTVTFMPPKGYEFINAILVVAPVDIKKSEDSMNSSVLTVGCTLSPKRPLSISVPFFVKNPLGQQWQFQVDLRVEKGTTQSKIVIESLLNKEGTATISVDEKCEMRLPFHAYFVSGSCSEFSVTPEHGFIEPQFHKGNKTELPVQIVFAPKMYGKVFKGVLVVDTLDSQYIFEVEGKTPQYVPPVVADGSSAERLDNVMSPEDKRRMLMGSRRRNIIKDNIDRAKITRPVVSATARSRY